jgi:hypothetical protein
MKLTYFKAADLEIGVVSIENIEALVKQRDVLARLANSVDWQKEELKELHHDYYVRRFGNGRHKKAQITQIENDLEVLQKKFEEQRLKLERIEEQVGVKDKDLPSIIADEITWEGDTVTYRKGDMYYSQKINLADKQVRYRR